ncbi:MAG TPA: hypothetical protein VGJ84_12195 [Polyangiaceae bacterium]
MLILPHRETRLALTLLLGVVTVASRSAAQPAPSAAPSESEQKEIQNALGADAAAKSRSPQPTPEPVPAASAPSGVGTQSLNPDISVIGDFAAGAFSDEDHLEAGAHDPKRNGFNLQALELAIGAAVDPYFRFDGNITFDLVEVDIEEAYATTLGLPAQLQAHFGQFLTRFGRLNTSHPHRWNFVDQPFALSRVFGGEGNRGLGVELSWLTPLPWYVELVGSATMAEGDETNRSFLNDTTRTVKGPVELEYVTAVKQFFPLSDDWSLAWGLSGAFGPNASGPRMRTAIYGTDLYLKFRPISYTSDTIVGLTSEWFFRRRHVPRGVIQDLSSYSELFWRFTLRWALAGRYEYGSPPLNSRWGNFGSDPLDPEWTAERHRVGTNLTFFPTEFSRLRAQVAVDLPAWRDPIWMAFLAAEVAVGAHGAHAF